MQCVCGLTEKAQRPGPRGRWIATVMRWPGSLQRMVERSRCAAEGQLQLLMHRPEFVIKFAHGFTVASSVFSRLRDYRTVTCSTQEDVVNFPQFFEGV